MPAHAEPPTNAEASRDPARRSHRRVIVAGLIIFVFGLLVVAAFWPRANSWPARAVASGPPGAALLDWGDDNRMVFGDQAVVVAIDPFTGESRTRAATGLISGRVLSRDRRHFVATDLRANATHQVAWGDAGSGEIEQRFGDPHLQAFQPAFEPDERWVRAFLRDIRWPNQLRFVATWDLATGVEARRPVSAPGWIDPRSDSTVVSPDGRTLAYLNRTQNAAQFWDVATDRPLGPPFGAGAIPLTQAEGSAFTPDGQQLVLARTDGRAELWDRGGMLLRRFVVHSGFRTVLGAVSPDGRWFASGGISLAPETQAGRAILQARAFFPAAQWRAVHEVAVIDLGTGQPAGQIAGAAAPHFAPNSRALATLGHDDTWTIRTLPPPERR